MDKSIPILIYLGERVQLIIEIDIDNVIADFDSKFKEKLNNRYKLRLKRKDIVTFDYYKCTPITKEQEKKAYDEFVKEGWFRKLRTIPFARHCLEILSKKHTIILITARSKKIEKDTLMWLKKRKIPYHDIVFSKTKHFICKSIDILIEDKWQDALVIARMRKRVLLLDYPWNRRNIEHQNIHRVKNWNGILEKIDNIKLS